VWIIDNKPKMKDDFIDLGLGSIHIENEHKVASISEHYSAPFGMPTLRKFVARMENVSPNNVVITSGASMGLVATLCQLDRSTIILIPTPGYPSYVRIVEQLGFSFEYYTIPITEKAEVNVSEFHETFGWISKVAILVNSPGNPLGNVISKRAMNVFLEFAQKRNSQVIVDEAYADFVLDPNSEDWKGVGIGNNLIRIKSFSKTHQVPGERLGYVIAESSTIERIGHSHWVLAMSPSISSQLIVSEKLFKFDPTIFNQNLEQLKRNRDLLYANLVRTNLVSVVKPRSGIFLWVKMLSCDIKNDDLVNFLKMEVGIVVTSGHHFGKNLENYFRCSYGISQYLIEDAAKQLSDGLEQMCSVISKQK
jgi:aspartate/methionine/tyrosine aminotransferase